MEVKKRKAVNFDLDTDLLIKYHPSHTDKSAYGQIRNYMEQNGFVHRQYSGYHSEKRMTDTEVTYILQGLFNKYPWLDKCAKVVDITNIGRNITFWILEKQLLAWQMNKKCLSISMNITIVMIHLKVVRELLPLLNLII